MFIHSNSFTLPINAGFDPTVCTPWHTYIPLQKNFIIRNVQPTTTKTVDVWLNLDWLWFQAIIITVLVVLYTCWFIKTCWVGRWAAAETFTDPRTDWHHSVLVTNGILVGTYLMLSIPPLVDTVVGKFTVPYEKPNYCDFLTKPYTFRDSKIEGPLYVKKLSLVKNPLPPKLLGYQKKLYVYPVQTDGLRDLQMLNIGNLVYLGGGTVPWTPLFFTYKTLVRGIIIVPKTQEVIFEIFKIGINSYKNYAFSVHEQRIRFFRVGTRKISNLFWYEILKQTQQYRRPKRLNLGKCGSTVLSQCVVVRGALFKVVKKIDDLRYKIGLRGGVGIYNRDHFPGVKFPECGVRKSSRSLKIGPVYNTLKIYFVVCKRVFGGALNSTYGETNLTPLPKTGLSVGKLQELVTRLSLHVDVGVATHLYKYLDRGLRTGWQTPATFGQVVAAPHVAVLGNKQQINYLLRPAMLPPLQNDPVGGFTYRINCKNDYMVCSDKAQQDLNLVIFKRSIDYLLRICPLEGGRLSTKGTDCITKLRTFNRRRQVLSLPNWTPSNSANLSDTFVELKKNQNLVKPVQISPWLVRQTLTFLILERLNAVLLLKNFLTPRASGESVFGQLIGNDFNTPRGSQHARDRVNNLTLRFRRQRRRMATRRYWVRNYINGFALVGVDRTQITRHYQRTKPVALRSSKEVMVGLSGFRKHFNPKYQWGAPRREGWLRSIISGSQRERVLGAYTGTTEFQHKNTKQHQVLGMRRAATVLEVGGDNSLSNGTLGKGSEVLNNSIIPNYIRSLHELNKRLWFYPSEQPAYSTPHLTKQILSVYILAKINRSLYIGGQLTQPELIIRNRVLCGVRGFITGLALLNFEKQGFLKTTRFVIEHPIEHPVTYSLEFLLYNPAQPSRPRHIIRKPLNKRESFTPTSNMVPLGVSGRVYGADKTNNPRTWAENYKTVYNVVTTRQKYNKGSDLVLQEMPQRWDLGKDPATNSERAWFSVMPRAKQFRGPVKTYSQLLGIDPEHYTSYRFWKWYLREPKVSQHILHTWVGYVEHLGLGQNRLPSSTNASSGNYHYFISVIIQKVRRLQWWAAVTEPFVFRYLQTAEICGMLQGGTAVVLKKKTNVGLSPPYDYYRYPITHCSHELSHQAMVRRFDRMKGIDLFKYTTQVTLKDSYSVGSVLQKPQVYSHESSYSGTYTQRRRLWTKRTIFEIVMAEVRNRR